jgi:hypothetical protein
MRVKLFVTLCAGSAVLIFIYNGFIKINYLGYCQNKHKYLTNEYFVNNKINKIIIKGDEGGQTYNSKEDYLSEIKDCCHVHRSFVILDYGLMYGHVVSISSSYISNKDNSRSLIQNYYDECGNEVWKPLTGG